MIQTSENTSIKLSRCKCLEIELTVIDKNTGKEEQKVLPLNIEDTKKFHILKTNAERDEFLRNIKCVKEYCYRKNY